MHFCADAKYFQQIEVKGMRRWLAERGLEEKASCKQVPEGVDLSFFADLADNLNMPDMSEPPVAAVNCPDGQVVASKVGPNEYGAGAGECSQMCTMQFVLQWMSGVEEGACAAAGFATKLRDESVQPRKMHSPSSTFADG